MGDLDSGPLAVNLGSTGSGGGTGKFWDSGERIRRGQLVKKRG